MRKRKPSQGFTILEVMIAATLLVIASAGMAMATQMIFRHAQLEHELELAEETARTMVEQVQYLADISFPNLYAYFDADDSNDPEGPGTAPGNTYSNLTVPGLQAAANSPTGQLVEILLHTDETETNAALGLPRDLNGDGDALDTDVSALYRIMPVTVRIHWNYNGNSTVNQMETLATKQ